MNHQAEIERLISESRCSMCGEPMEGHGYGNSCQTPSRIMLAALKEIERGCVGFAPGHVNYHQNRTKAQIAEIARNAISKAEPTP